MWPHSTVSFQLIKKGIIPIFSSTSYCKSQISFFFIKWTAGSAGGSLHDAVGVCAHEMGDPQLALFLCTLLGESCRDLKTKLLEELLEGDAYLLYNMLDSGAKSRLGYILPASTFLNSLLLRFCHDALHFLFIINCWTMKLVPYPLNCHILRQGKVVTCVFVQRHLSRAASQQQPCFTGCLGNPELPLIIYSKIHHLRISDPEPGGPAFSAS